MLSQFGIVKLKTHIINRIYLAMKDLKDAQNLYPSSDENDIEETLKNLQSPKDLLNSIPDTQDEVNPINKTLWDAITGHYEKALGAIAKYVCEDMSQFEA